VTQPTARSFVLTLACPDRVGIVADVAGFLVGEGCNIVESAQHGDPLNGLFFMRTLFEADRPLGAQALSERFAPVAARHAMAARIFEAAAKTPTLIMVSRLGHCLNDLMFRWRIGALPIDIRGIVSNHRDFEALAVSAGVPFHYLPVTPQTKFDQERVLEAVVNDLGIELIVLARYMQILSADLCARFAGRMINIHHSFLPSFKGARPYHRAHERGVKLIGATAHYVTEELDEGPIIEQSVERVGHNLSVEDYVAVGRDVEALVLARAVKWHAEHRVLLNGGRTVVFQ
jgi:formyltetrahydrofolate deformylase